ncbi:MAG: hypothetical protein PHO15_09665 [Eubacteriales bacterium]|nr:hypothetical protein [Eubacteriales bacterium]
MKKTILMIIAAALAVCVLGGCADSGAPDETIQTGDTAEPAQTESADVPLTEIPGIQGISADDVICILRFDDSDTSGQPSRVFAQEEEIAAQLERFAAVRLTDKAGEGPKMPDGISYVIRCFDGTETEVTFYGDNGNIVDFGQGEYICENLPEETDDRELWIGIDRYSYPEGTCEIGYTLYNTGAVTQVSFVPLLEAATENGWESVYCSADFMMSFDDVEQGSVQKTVTLAGMFAPLEAGTYRLSIVHGIIDPAVKLSDVFEIEDVAGMAATYDSTFKLGIYTDKSAYEAGEAIACFATAEYIGWSDNATMHSSDPLVVFYITGGEYFNGDWAVNDVLVTTTFEKGEAVTYDFEKSGGYSADDPNADFWASYFAEEDLILPAGEYEITAMMDGDIAEGDDDSKYRQSVSIAVTVGE